MKTEDRGWWRSNKLEQQARRREREVGPDSINLRIRLQSVEHADNARSRSVDCSKCVRSQHEDEWSVKSRWESWVKWSTGAERWLQLDGSV
jgi:hypothetical protein